MAYSEFNINGRKMLNLDNLGMVDYDAYYVLLGKSYERRGDITNKYLTIQGANKVENEPNINYSVLYEKFLENLKKSNIELFDEKKKYFKDYIEELNAEERIFGEEKRQLLLKGYPFDNSLKRFGYYIIETDNNFFQYKRVVKKDINVDMGNDLLPQNVNISSFQLVPISLEELESIKNQVLRKSQFVEENMARRHK